MNQYFRSSRPTATSVSVRLSVRSPISKITCQNFTKFSILLWPQCHSLCTAVLRGWRQVIASWSEWARIKDDAYVLSSSPGGGISRTSDVWSSSQLEASGTKCAVSDCGLHVAEICLQAYQSIKAWQNAHIHKINTVKRRWTKNNS